MNPNFQDIQPADSANVSYWTRKWGITAKELNDAILYTGSLNPSQVHTYLTRDSWIYHPVKAGRKLITNTYRLIF